VTKALARTSLGIAALLVGWIVAACATLTETPAALTQAQAMYAALLSQHAELRIEGDMIRARAAIDTAQSAVMTAQEQLFADAEAQVALRTVQTARAHYDRGTALAAADSVQRLGLTRQLALAQAREAEFQRQSAAANARADSLYRAAELANAQLDKTVARLQSLVAEITDLKETPRGLVITLGDSSFSPGKAALTPSGEAAMRKIANALQEFPGRSISVEGYTDSAGNAGFNQQLSIERAAVVREALVTGGMDSTRITSQSFAQTDPMATNSTAAGRSQNRRVEIIVQGAAKVPVNGDHDQPLAHDTRTGPDTAGRPPF
jgi:outer membrane protein OmpA-like peptidoglycan-associated protein